MSSRFRRAAIAAAVILAALIAHDLSVESGRGYAARMAIRMIDTYRAHASTRIGTIVTCRFTPTCSSYGREAFAKHGFAKGLAKTSWRLARCGPWTPAGTRDLP